MSAKARTGARAGARASAGARARARAKAKTRAKASAWSCDLCLLCLFTYVRTGSGGVRVQSQDCRGQLVCGGSAGD